jgi:hypothetical protein
VECDANDAVVPPGRHRVDLVVVAGVLDVQLVEVLVHRHRWCGHVFHRGVCVWSQDETRHVPHVLPRDRIDDHRVDRRGHANIERDRRHIGASGFTDRARAVQTKRLIRDSVVQARSGADLADQHLQGSGRGVGRAHVDVVEAIGGS